LFRIETKEKRKFDEGCFFEKFRKNAVVEMFCIQSQSAESRLIMMGVMMRDDSHLTHSLE
jgi:hypothetical protein